MKKITYIIAILLIGTVSCTTQKKAMEFVDSDLDGVHDLRDACPHEPGSFFNLGCPEDASQVILAQIDQAKSTDSDLDGVMDDKDECPYVYGSPFNMGCPIGDK